MNFRFVKLSQNYQYISKQAPPHRFESSRLPLMVYFHLRTLATVASSPTLAVLAINTWEKV